MENGKNADFELLDSSNSTILVDVVSIHLNAREPKKIFQEINRKLNSKLNSKFGGIPIQGKYLLPVIWFDFSLRHLVLNTIKNSDLAAKNIISPCTLFITPEDITKSYIATIESVLPQ